MHREESEYNSVGKLAMATATTSTDQTVRPMGAEQPAQVTKRTMASMEKLQYRNFSEVPENATPADIERIMKEGKEEEIDCDSDGDETSKMSPSTNMRLGSQPLSFGTSQNSIFPTKLYRILADPRFNEIIRWLPHGRSWEVIDPKAFMKHVAPTFFSFSKYASFTRQITGWCFRRKTNGPDRNSYYHELFLRGKPHLVKFMKREVSGARKKDDTKYEDPNLYELSKKHPLPALPEAPPPGIDEYSRQSRSYTGNWGEQYDLPPPPGDHNQMFPYPPPPMNYEYHQDYHQWMPPPDAPPPQYMPQQQQYYDQQGEGQVQSQSLFLEQYPSYEHQPLPFAPPSMSYPSTSDGYNSGQWGNYLPQPLHVPSHGAWPQDQYFESSSYAQHDEHQRWINNHYVPPAQAYPAVLVSSSKSSSTIKQDNRGQADHAKSKPNPNESQSTSNSTSRSMETSSTTSKDVKHLSPQFEPPGTSARTSIIQADDNPGQKRSPDRDRADEQDEKQDQKQQQQQKEKDQDQDQDQDQQQQQQQQQRPPSPSTERASNEGGTFSNGVISSVNALVSGGDNSRGFSFRIDGGHIEPNVSPMRITRTGTGTSTRQGGGDSSGIDNAHSWEGSGS